MNYSEVRINPAIHICCHYRRCGTTSYLVEKDLSVTYHKHPFTDLLSIVASDMFVEGSAELPDSAILITDGWSGEADRPNDREVYLYNPPKPEIDHCYPVGGSILVFRLLQ